MVVVKDCFGGGGGRVVELSGVLNYSQLLPSCPFLLVRAADIMDSRHPRRICSHLDDSPMKAEEHL